tara:strand:+ start:845 stop:2347 length:1503 start_codon:yes stop_codon:yes gene_type:complete
MATKIRSSNIDSDVLTGNTELAASAAADDVLLVFDTSAGVIKKIQASNVGLLAPRITNVSPTNLTTGDGTGNHTIVVTGTRFLSDVTCTLIKTGGSALAFDTVTRNSSTQLTCVIAKSSVLNADEPFDIKVTTEGGVLTHTLENHITLDASPVFVTAAGSLGSVLETTSKSFQVTATDPESAGVVTFELQSGALPTGFSLTNTSANGGSAIISGTAPSVSANTISNFVLRAVDAASNTTSRAFSITVQNDPTSTSFTSSGTFAVPTGMTVADVLVVAGGGGSNSQPSHPIHRAGSSGGGAGGLIFMPEVPVTPQGTIAITVGCGGPSGGQDSIFGASPSPGTTEVLTAKGGGVGGSAYGNPGPYNDGGNGGSGGGSNRGSPSSSQGIQPTQPGNSGAYGFGNPGGTGSGSDGGGGGGAGAAGTPNDAGGIGKAYTIADGTTSVYYAGGGGGGPGASGGQGGGGPGGMVNGQANKGGGAGGSSGIGQGSAPGGKGIVIVRG